jgi:hypothetical protein
MTNISSSLSSSSRFKNFLGMGGRVSSGRFLGVGVWKIRENSKREREQASKRHRCSRVSEGFTACSE